MRDFDSIPITTAVLVGKLTIPVTIRVIFPFLPVTPALTAPGSIYRLQYDALLRGGDPVEKEGRKRKGCADRGFPNILNCKMVITGKRMDIKLSSESIQITGVKSEDNVKETIALLFTHLVQLQHDLNALRDGKTRTLLDRLETSPEIETWLTTTTRSADVETWLKTEQVFRDGIVPEQFVSHLEYVMVNKNISERAEPVHLGKLALRLRELDATIGILYINSLHHDIVVWRHDDELTEEEEEEGSSDEEEEEKVSYAKRTPIHKFTLRRSGQITQSGRNLDRMRQAYDFFVDLLGRI